MTRRGRRLALIAAALAVVGGAAGLSLYALSDSIVFFYSPSEVAQKARRARRAAAHWRHGENGLAREIGGPECRLRRHRRRARPQSRLSGSAAGPVPRRSRRGRRGRLAAPGQMRADTILAKHDERYMPREVVDALKKQGRWQEGTTAAANDRRDRPFRPCARACRRARPDHRAASGRACRRHRRSWTSAATPR